MSFPIPAEVFKALEPPSPVLSLVGTPDQFERRAVAFAQIMQKHPAASLVEGPVVHRFTPGVYVREIKMPAGAIVVGHLHRTEHENIVLSGRATVIINGECVEVSAGDVLTSKAGSRKALHIHEEMRWLTVHPNPENITDTDALEEIFVDKNAAKLHYPEEMEALESAFAIERRIA